MSWLDVVLAQPPKKRASGASFTLNPSAASGYLQSTDPDYATERAGLPANIAVNVGGGFTVGQFYFPGDTYTAAYYAGMMGFIDFNLSAVTGTVCTAAELSLGLSSDSSTTNFTVEARSTAWGASLDAADWVGPVGGSGSDDFNRATLNTADSGQTWSAANGSPTITSNQFAGAGTSAPGDLAVAEFNAPNGRIKVTAGAVSSTDSSSAGAVFRYVDNNNYWRCLFGRVGSGAKGVLQRKLSGSYADIRSVSGSAANGDIIEAEFIGSTLRLFYNGTQIGTDVSDSSHVTASKAGLYTDYTSAWRLDTWRLDARPTIQNIASSTLLATLASSGIGGTGSYKAMTESGSALRDAVTAAIGGTLRIVLLSDNHRSASVPSDEEYLDFESYAASNKPKLVITTT